jgi:hypothetical protein
MANEPNNNQYGKPLFGFPGQPDNTGLEGSDGGSTYGAYDNGNLPAGHVADLASTGAPGGPGQAPPRDGGSAVVTDGHYAGIPDGTVSGPTSTSKSALVDPFVHGGSFGGGKFSATDTGAGHGTAATERP